MNVRPFLNIGMICLWLGGCAVTGIGGSAAPDTYNLSAPNLSEGQFKRWPIQLMVQRPNAIRALDTDRIVVMSSGGRLAYFQGAAWGDRLTSLVQARLVEAMQDAEAFRAVLTSEDRVGGEYTLSVQIREFGVEVDNGKAEAVVRLFAKLVHERRGEVLATREFTARAPATKDDPASGVAALQDNFDKVTRDLVRWLSSRRGRSSS